jgi:hypothetical protein
LNATLLSKFADTEEGADAQLQSQDIDLHLLLGEWALAEMEVAP